MHKYMFTSCAGILCGHVSACLCATCMSHYLSPFPSPTCSVSPSMSLRLSLSLSLSLPVSDVPTRTAAR